eukprot:353742-Chlamydomonas_euryale.AAC.1
MQLSLATDGLAWRRFFGDSEARGSGCVVSRREPSSWVAAWEGVFLDPKPWPPKPPQPSPAAMGSTLTPKILQCCVPSSAGFVACHQVLVPKEYFQLASPGGFARIPMCGFGLHASEALTPWHHP